MVNRTGSGSQIPDIQRGSVPAQAFPRIQPSSAVAGAGDVEAQLLNQSAQVLAGVSERLEQRLDIQAEIQARNEGVIAGNSGVPERRDDSTIRGRAFNISARDAALTRLDLNARQRLSALEEQHSANPIAFSAQATDYLNGNLRSLRQFDPEAALEFENRFSAHQQAAEKRIATRERQILADRQLEDALRLQSALQENMAASAADLFSDDPELAGTAYRRMIQDSAVLVDAAHQIGPDGTPLFNARQRIAFENAAEEMVAQQIGLAWMGRQGDLLTAFDVWRKGEAMIEVADEKGRVQKVGIHDILGPSGTAKVEGVFFEKLRSQLALEAQVDAARERQFKDRSDALFSDLSVLAQDGNLSLNVIEASRGSLEEDRYLTLRAAAKGGGAQVSNGEVLSGLIQRDAAGLDIRGDLRAARKDLTTDDFIKLYDRNSKRLDQGVIDPVRSGRDFVGNSLGKLSSELGFAQSVAIPKAEAEYETRIQQFIEKNERQPSHTEALDIGRDVVDRYAATDVEAFIAAAPKPRLMTAAQKVSKKLSSDDMGDIATKTTEFFLKKHNGDVEAMKADDEYQREMMAIDDIQQVLQQKELGRARTSE